MRVNECMTRDVEIANPRETLRHAAQAMARIDAGALPVGENDRLVGMITDRDIAVRGVGKGRSPDATVGEVMSKEVKYCFEDDDADDVLRNMAELQVRRLPVLDREKRLVGIISLSDLAAKGLSPRDGSLPPDLPAAAIRLQGENGAEFWLVFNNFFAITRYNRSYNYAMAVFQLSEALRAGRQPPPN